MYDVTHACTILTLLIHVRAISLYNSPDTHDVSFPSRFFTGGSLVDAKAYLEREAESFHDFAHTMIARFAQSHVARALISILSLLFRFYYRFVSVSL